MYIFVKKDTKKTMDLVWINQANNTQSLPPYLNISDNRRYTLEFVWICTKKLFINIIIAPSVFFSV